MSDGFTETSIDLTGMTVRLEEWSFDLTRTTDG